MKKIRFSIFSLSIFIFLNSSYFLEAREGDKFTKPSSTPPPNVGVDEKLDTYLPLDISFLNENDEEITLRNILDGRHPVIIIPSYYSCTRLCSFVFHGVQKVVDELELISFSIKKDYKIISLSINPKDNSHAAFHKGEEIRNSFKNVKVDQQRWSFLRLKNSEISNFMKTLGFRYTINPKDSDDIAHAATMILISPDGKITRYLYGINFVAREFRLALLEAGEGKIGSPLEKFILYCFHYDTFEGKYTPHAWAFIRIGGIVTMIFIILLWYFARRK